MSEETEQSVGGVKEVRQKTMQGLQIVTADPPPPNPAEFLRFQRFGSFLERVCREFDYTLLDRPPTSFVSGPPERRPAQAEGVLLVLDAQNTRKGGRSTKHEKLESVGANLLGTV